MTYHYIITVCFHYIHWTLFLHLRNDDPKICFSLVFNMMDILVVVFVII